MWLQATAAALIFSISTWNSAIHPVGKLENPGWMKRFEQISSRVHEGPYDVAFVGDSITELWLLGGEDVWQERIAPLNAVNLGVSADQTQHVLWRLQNGHFDGLNPKVTVIMAGTNNIEPGPFADSPVEIVEGIASIVDEVLTRAPESKVLLLALFPRKDVSASLLDVHAQVNRRLAAIAWPENVRFLDITEAFLEPDGTLSDYVMWDYLHLTSEGYERWANAMVPVLEEMLAN
jgi:beta-glucosidase